jgi:N-acetylglucosaminyldiphosphoundecaprenol N-acetyl-beta-D-mannosaminyltransferase
LNVERFYIGTVGISATNLSAAVDALDRLVAAPRGKYACLANVRTTVLAQREEEFCAVQNASALTLPDGMPLVWYAWLAGVQGVDRVPGPDLMCAVLARSAERDYSHFFYGETEEALNCVLAVVHATYPGARVVGKR